MDSWLPRCRGVAYLTPSSGQSELTIWGQAVETQSFITNRVCTILPERATKFEEELEKTLTDNPLLLDGYWSSEDAAPVAESVSEQRMGEPAGSCPTSPA